MNEPTGSTVVVRVPTALRRFTNEQAAVTITLDGDASSVGDVLRALGEVCPGVIDRVLDEQGRLRRHVNLFVGPDNVRSLSGLETPVPDGGELSILPAVSGG